jgi:hypothetical protein
MPRKYQPESQKLTILAHELRQMYNRGMPLDTCKEFAAAIKAAFENTRDWPGFQMFCLNAGLYDERETDESEATVSGATPTATTGPEDAAV